MSVSAVTSGTTTSATLVKLGNGEYTADSVSKDQTDATRLGLVKEKDGNYGTTPPAPTDSTAVAQSSSAVLSSLSSLSIGGK